jgi:uncharacterized membrane protein YccC
MAGRLIRFFRPIHDGLWAEFDSLASDRENMREPLKAVLSVLLSVAIACLVNLPDIVWAALSGFLVMRSTLAEAVPRCLHRVIGTVTGAALGFVLGRFLVQDMALMIAALFVLSWVAVYQGSVSPYRYGWLLFGVTAVMVITAALGDAPGAARFAAVRVAEVVIGSLSALFVAALFEAFGAPPGLAAPQGEDNPEAHLSFRSVYDEIWLHRNWPIVIHAAQAALSVALLPFVWRFFGITNFVQTAVTAFIVMIIPLNAIESGSKTAVYERIAHRLLGCLIGGALALLCLGIAADDPLLWVLCLCAGVWIGFHIQSGKTGLSYLGTQFAFAFLVSFVQGPGPATSLDPPLTRLLGVLIGAGMMSVVMLAWPSRPNASARA